MVPVVPKFFGNLRTILGLTEDYAAVQFDRGPRAEDARSLAVAFKTRSDDQSGAMFANLHILHGEVFLVFCLIGPVAPRALARLPDFGSGRYINVDLCEHPCGRFFNREEELERALHRYALPEFLAPTDASYPQTDQTSRCASG